MKFSFSLFLSLLVLCPAAIAGTQNSDCSKPSYLLAMLDKYHYQPVKMTDNISAQIFESFLKMADPHLTFFTDREITQLARYRTSLDDEIKNKSCGFMQLATELYTQQLKKVDSLIADIAKQPYDYCARDTMFFSNKRYVDYADDETSLKKRWAKWLKYQTLSYLFTFNTQSEVPAKGCKVPLPEEPQIREKIALKNRQYIQEMLDDPKGVRHVVASILCNAITSRFDPHTMFLSPDESQQFKESLSSQAPSFGLWLGETSNGGTQITQLVPGGPAWKSNELNEGDIVMQLQWPDGKPIDLTLSGPDEVEYMFSYMSSNIAEITVKKANGMMKTVKLAKEMLHSSENIINGLVLQGAEKKIGYISLPSFYTEWDYTSGLGCANDVAKEILKLRAEHIDGLILDLRNNAGGSMEEALELAGIFIDEGPLSILQSRNEKPFVLKDLSRGTLYDGPLEVLVNSGSASASELLAAALQDYNRAVIVGSSTFGKATSQTVLPMDTAVMLNMADPATENQLGYVVMTLSKFYRVTRASHQLNGVTPDIRLPELFLNEMKESTMPFALAADSVNKKTIFTALPPLPLKELTEQSAQRIARDEGFKKIQTLVDSLNKESLKEKAVPLELEAYRKFQKSDDELFESLDNLLTRPAASFTVSNSSFDQESLNIDEDAKENNSALLKEIHEDIYLNEAFNIILDLIELKK